MLVVLQRKACCTSLLDLEQNSSGKNFSLCRDDVKGVASPVRNKKDGSPSPRLW